MRQVGILRAGCPHALDYHVERLADDHATAAYLAERLREVEGLEIPHPVQSNIVIVELSGLGSTAAEVVPALAEAGVLVVAADATRVRLVTHMDVSLEQVARAAGTAVRVLSCLGGGHSRMTETHGVTCGCPWAAPAGVAHGPRAADAGPTTRQTDPPLSRASTGRCSRPTR